MESTEVQLNKDKHFGVPDLLTSGPSSVKNDLVSSHPLEKSEKNFEADRQAQEMMMLRKTQGLHAPLKLRMEQHIVQQINRGPSLSGSNALLDALTGRDGDIGFEDFLNVTEDQEVIGQPHALQERRDGLL